MTSGDGSAFSDGFAAPILWGAKRGYSIAAIAAGLELHPTIVRAVIESRSGVRFPRVLDKPAEIDETRTDPAYVAWARASRGAQLTRHGGVP